MLRSAEGGLNIKMNFLEGLAATQFPRKLVAPYFSS
jgi:hypothetical protein